MCRKICILLLLAFMIINLTSCYDAHEINDFAFVTIIGIDKGISDKWRLTIKYRVIQADGTGQSGSGGGSNQGAYKYQTETIDAPSFFAAVDLINTNIPRTLNFQQVRLIVVSEEIARGGFLGEFMAPIIRFRQIRRTSNIVVTEGTARNFTENFMPFLGSTVTRTIEDFFLKYREESGYFPTYNLDKFYEDIKTTYGQPVIALGSVNNYQNFKEEGRKWGVKYNISGDYYAGETPRKNGDSIEFLGSAIFDGDIMVGKLTGNETRMMLIVSGKFPKGIFTVQDPKASQFVVPLKTWQVSKPNVKVSFIDGKPIIDLKIRLIGDILAIQSRIDYESPELKPILEKAAEKLIYNGIVRTIDKCKALNCDVFRFGTVAAMKFWTIEEWEKYNWNTHFKDAQINVEVKYTILRSGTLINNAPIASSKGKE